MSYWTTIENPSQELLDKLWKESSWGSKVRWCPGCNVLPGQVHQQGCDVARCTVCGGQHISCDCDVMSLATAADTWRGTWPGIWEAYRNGLVCHGPNGVPILDLNAVAERRALGTLKLD